jgi:hypothetical protein
VPAETADSTPATSAAPTTVRKATPPTTVPKATPSTASPTRHKGPRAGSTPGGADVHVSGPAESHPIKTKLG